MKYLLDEDEYQALARRETPAVSEYKSRALMATRATMLKMVDFTCHAETYRHNGYCDDCPVVGAAESATANTGEALTLLEHMCPLSKRWSK